ncbi:GIY-YIG nuclease family protein [Candidatus Berkelbacteria bacterium]|nr:GIY-YIG nuclease family protein [Candidatus Berkelbacteria bacterium]MBI4029641.1 GIY-YIG nuclease family protein [Candidatus Berkelbacteria bacterium]
MPYAVYILLCSDDYFYTGITSNLDKRISEHRHGLSKLTKNRLPIRLVYSEDFKTRKEAAKREKEIKGWRREKKESLIESLRKI